MTRVDSIRTQIQNLVRSAPFHPFAMSLENGDRIVIEHPENIAFDPSERGADFFSVVSDRLQSFSTFSAVTSVARLDRGQATDG